MNKFCNNTVTYGAYMVFKDAEFTVDTNDMKTLP